MKNPDYRYYTWDCHQCLAAPKEYDTAKDAEKARDEWCTKGSKARIMLVEMRYVDEPRTR